MALLATAGSRLVDRAAPNQPLLVVVEGDRTEGVGADSIRRTVAEELGRPVVGPHDRRAATAPDVLLVTVGQQTVAMELRRSNMGSERRQVQAVPSGVAGLQVVAWLAGNLVRDKVAEVLPAVHAQNAPPPATAAVLATSAETAAVAPPIEEPQPTRAATDPPPQRLPDTRGPVAVAREERPLPTGPSPAAPWRLGMQAGAGIWLHPSQVLGDGGPFFPTARIEVLAPPLRERWSPWAALNVQGGWTAIGVSTGFVRRVELRRDRWAAEFGAGAGLLVAQTSVWGVQSGQVITRPETTILPLVHAVATLVFTHSSLGDVVMSTVVNESLRSPRRPDLILTWGLRLGF